MSAKNDNLNAELKDSRSSRLSIVKKLWKTKNTIFFLSRKDGSNSSFAMNLGNKFLWDELTKAGYSLPSSLNKEESINILYSDIMTIKGFSETRKFDIYRLACKVIPSIKELSKPKQKQYMKVLTSVLKISDGNDTSIVGASVRARVELQKAFFATPVKKEHQNAALDALCELGLGELDRGASYLMLESLDLLESLESNAKRPTLSKVTLAYPDVKEDIKEIDVVAYLVSLSLIADVAVDFTEELESKAVYNPETGLHTIVEPEGSVNFQKFKYLLAQMDDAYAAFKSYCTEASAEYTLIRTAWKGSEEGKAALAAKRETELMATAEREINNITRAVEAEAKTKKKINITEKRQRDLDLGLAILVEDGTRMIYFHISTNEKEKVLSGRMKMERGIPRWNHEFVDPDAVEEVQDDSWMNGLLAGMVSDDADEVVEVRIDRYAGMTFDEKKIQWAKEKEEANLRAFDAILAML